MKAREREAFEAQIKEAERVQAAGGEIDPMAALLLRVRGDRDDGEPAAKPAPRIEAPKTHFIVDSTGNAAPAPSVESAPQTPEPAAAAAPKAPPFTPPPEPKPEPPHPIWRSPLVGADHPDRRYLTMW